MVMNRPTDWTRAIGMVANAVSMGAVVAGFAISGVTLHYSGPSLASVSISQDRFATDRCTDDPADPTCPPVGPADVKCASAAWQGTAWCVGGPFAPSIVTPPPLQPVCSPTVAGCPGFVPPAATPPPDAPPTPPTKGHQPPPHEPPPHGPPPGGPPPGGPPPVIDHPEPGGPAATPPADHHSDPGAPAPLAPPEMLAPAHIQAPVPVAPAPAPIAQAPVMAPAPAPPPSSSK
jgi:hypothetical protein